MAGCHGENLSVHGSGQQLQRAVLHALERDFLGGSLTKVDCKNEASGLLSLVLVTLYKSAGGTEYP